MSDIHARLTTRQMVILEHLSQGKSDTEIARTLGCTIRMVRRELASIYRALPFAEAGNQRVAAALWYVQQRGSRELPWPRHGRARLRAAEWAVLQHVAQGESDKQIARALQIVPQTVKNHLSGSYHRLPLGDAANRRVAAAVWHLLVGREQFLEEW